MITLAATSTSVATNSHRSDLSVRAISLYPSPSLCDSLKPAASLTETSWAAPRGQPSPVAPDKDSELTRRGGLCSQRPAPYRRVRTDDCSPRVQPFQAAHGV